MRYIVDGSNLLGGRGEFGAAGAGLRLLGIVERFCRLSRSTAVVSFDVMEGRAPGSEFRFGERVSARIAPAGCDSDRADRDIILQVRRQPGVIVVTDDAALTASVRALGAGVMATRTFSRRLESPRVGASDKEAAASGIDNAEFLRLWTGETP
jgi:hypothetical protein